MGRRSKREERREGRQKQGGREERGCKWGGGERGLGERKGKKKQRKMNVAHLSASRSAKPARTFCTHGTEAVRDKTAALSDRS